MAEDAKKGNPLYKLTAKNYNNVCGYFLFVLVNRKAHREAARLRILMDTKDLKKTQEYLGELGPSLTSDEGKEALKVSLDEPVMPIMKKVPVSEWEAKLRSKRDLYNILREDAGFVLPKFKNCKRRFLVQLCNGEKTGLPIHNARPIDPPRYPCFETDALWDTFSRKAELTKYLPDVAPGSLPDREFLCTLINSVFPGKIKELKNECVKARIATLGKGAKSLEVLEAIADKVKAATSIPTGSIQSSVFKELIPENRAERNVQKYTRLKRKIKANIPLDKRSQRISRQKAKLAAEVAKPEQEVDKQLRKDAKLETIIQADREKCSKFMLDCWKELQHRYKTVEKKPIPSEAIDELITTLTKQNQ